MNILHEIAASAKQRVEEKKKSVPLESVIEMAQTVNICDFPFESAISSARCSTCGAPDIAFICEIKKASPSKGAIAKGSSHVDIAREYEAAGAAAISVLTEPIYFKGADHFLREIANTVSLPLLRKDFTVDSYMIYEAKALGACAILLICAILDVAALAEYISVAHLLGLSALVETHSEDEIRMALDAGARIIGVNNRNLTTFEVDITLSEKLRNYAPKDVLFVSESGVRSPKDVAKLREIGVDAVLIGETLMRSKDKTAEIARLRGCYNNCL